MLRQAKTWNPWKAALPCILIAMATALLPRPATSQLTGFTPGDWNRVETEHFLFLFPTGLSEWALHLAERMEAVHAAVSALVGYAPEERVTVVVDDPLNVSNGAVVPGPLLYMWPTPPGPRTTVGEHRGWTEILAVHEFAHAAHLTRPSRNPLERFFLSLLPVPIRPMMLRAPRWVSEGYATYVEGRVTGYGRPHGVWRPAVLRSWALEGRLPTYGALDGTDAFFGDAMAYLAGSAFLEWLVEGESRVRRALEEDTGDIGDRRRPVAEDGVQNDIDGVDGTGSALDEELLPHVWRRLTARYVRDFEGAFEGVFGYPPEELYGAFTVDVTERALAVRDAVEDAGGVVHGTLFQRLEWHTGDPALSPNGRQLALVLRDEDDPPRLVVISTTPDTLATEERERRERIFEDDPEDVPPVERRPRAQEPLATLRPAVGRAYDMPAFMPDGRGILVVRSDVRAGGLSRPDLFLWEWDRGAVRRVTRGEAIREASPAPDGSWAVGTRCLGGRCDLVRIEIPTGEVTTLAEGGFERPYLGPRVSPDGGGIVVSVQEDGRWRLVALDADGGGERPLGPEDGADRFDPAFFPAAASPGTTRLALTSTRGGIPSLETMELETGEVEPLTRVLGAAVAPAPGPGGEVFFLALHSRGWDLRRIDSDAERPAPVAAQPALSPAAPTGPVPGEALPPSPVGPVQPYGAGPRFRTLLPIANFTTDGSGAGAAYGSNDPTGRLAWLLEGTFGTDDAARGVAVHALWRGTRPWIGGSVFLLDDLFPRATPATPPPPADADGWFDRRYAGASARAELHRTALGLTQLLSVGGSAAVVPGGDGRVLAFAGYDVDLRQLPGSWELLQRVRLHGASGRTAEEGWSRWRVDGRLEVQGQNSGIALLGTVGGTNAEPGSVETFAVGGPDPLLLDPALVAQRVSMPALPSSELRGGGVRVWRAELLGEAPLRPFYWAGRVTERADGSASPWRRVAGLEVDAELESVPLLRLPGVHFRLGYARLLTDPDDGRWRGWLFLGYRP